MYDEALKALDVIEKSRNVDIMNQVILEKKLIELRQEIEKGNDAPAVLGDIEAMVQNDNENELDTAIPGQFSEYDVLTSYFSDLPIDTLDEEIFPPNMEKPVFRSPSTPVTPGAPRNRQYIDALSAGKRLNFLKNNFKIERVRIGKDKFMGTLIFEIADSDLVIAENFFRVTNDGRCIEDYGKATYILPKESALDLIQLSRGELREKAGKEGQIKTVRHESEKYYEYLVERFNSLQSSRYNPIKIENSNSSELSEDEVLSTIETLSNNEDSVINENKTPFEDIVDDKDLNSTPSDTSQNSTSQYKNLRGKDISEIVESNKAFFDEINQNLGGIITPTIMEGLISKASYSFSNLYNQRLKDMITDSLEVLDVPKNQRDLEAQKVFLYMRIAKNLSLVNNHILHNDEVQDLVEVSALEHGYAFDFYLKHKDDGLSYKDFRKGLKEYALSQIDIFDSVAPEITPENEKSSKSSQILGDVETKSEVDTDEVYNPLIGKKAPQKKIDKAMDIATKFANLMAELDRVNRQLERAENMLNQKQDEYRLAIEATQDAKNQEEIAKLATKQAVSHEASAKEQMETAQKEAEGLRESKENLEKTISTIEDLLK